jgi:hypothetical protein
MPKVPNTHVGMKNLHKLLKGEHILGLTNVHFEKDRVEREMCPWAISSIFW